MRHVYKWRSDIGAEAIEAVKKFWEEEHLVEKEDREMYAKMLLKPSDSPYLYGRITTKMQNGTLVVEVCRSYKCVDVKTLKTLAHRDAPHPETPRPIPALCGACRIWEALASNRLCGSVWQCTRCALACFMRGMSLTIMQCSALLIVSHFRLSVPGL